MRYFCPHCNEELISMKLERLTQTSQELYFDFSPDGVYEKECASYEKKELTLKLTCERCKGQLTFEDLLRTGFSNEFANQLFITTELE